MEENREIIILGDKKSRFYECETCKVENKTKYIYSIM